MGELGDRQAGILLQFGEDEQIEFVGHGDRDKNYRIGPVLDRNYVARYILLLIVCSGLNKMPPNTTAFSSLLAVILAMLSITLGASLAKSLFP